MTRRVLRDLRRLFSRRRALQGLGATGLVGCGDDSSAQGDGTTGEPTSSSSADTATSKSTDSSESGPVADASSSGESSSSTGEPPMSDCEETSDLTAAELLAPIEHIVVVCMENRSFDHMFGARSLVEDRPIDGLTGTETNPDAMGNPVAVYHLEYPAVLFDPPHSWDGSREQWNDGANDGFVTSFASEGAPTPEEVMGFYERADLPVSWALADNYTLCDRWFSSVMGPTWPNRFCLHLGSAYGKMDNSGIDTDPPSIFSHLSDAGITNIFYNSNLPFVLTYGKTDGVEQIAMFFESAAAGTLPQFSMLDPILTANGTIGNDDHPPASVDMGQAFIATIYEALAQSPLWDRCLLVILYDEHGGFHDHVSPPTTVDDTPGFEQLGFRVPTLVVGPYVRRGCASSTQFDHVSVAATATARWGLEPLTPRAAATNDLSSCIDPSFLDNPQPPAPLPKMLVRRPQVVRPGIDVGGQQELEALMDRLALPPHLDRRAQAQETMDTILDWGVRLGAIELVD